MGENLLKKTILVVDDIPDNIDILDGILNSDYSIRAATSGEMALKIATSDNSPDLILLDIMMPEMDGYEICSQLKGNSMTKNIPVIFVTSKNDVIDEKKGFELGAVDYITKPVSPPIVEARVKTHLALYDQNRELERKVKERTFELNDTRLEIIRRLGRAAEYKDNETGLHVIRMSKYSQQIALSHGMSEEDAELILNAAPMHDVGKIGIPDSILLKPDKLDDTEWALMKKHCEFGIKIIGEHSSVLLKHAGVAAQSHHEKWNGKGYPRGLKSDAIPLIGRITAIADVFDALTSERPYKKAWEVDDALDFIRKEKGEHFDPELLESFINVIPEILRIREKYAEV
jgi:putative two-component system response regulator